MSWHAWSTALRIMWMVIGAGLVKGVSFRGAAFTVKVRLDQFSWVIGSVAGTASSTVSICVARSLSSAPGSTCAPIGRELRRRGRVLFPRAIRGFAIHALISDRRVNAWLREACVHPGVLP